MVLGLQVGVITDPREIAVYSVQKETYHRSLVTIQQLQDEASVQT